MHAPLIPSDPDFAARVTDSFSRQGFMALLGATITRVEPGLVEIEAPFRGDLTQQHGYFHAGVTSALADTAGGYAGFTLFPADSSLLTVEFKINLIAPARGDRLAARGQVVKSGRTLTVCARLRCSRSTGRGSQATARSARCAPSGQQTLICLHGRADA